MLNVRKGKGKGENKGRLVYCKAYILLKRSEWSCKCKCKKRKRKGKGEKENIVRLVTESATGVARVSAVIGVLWRH